jgi:hypothetical protein
MPATKPKPPARVWLVVALICAGATLLIYIHNSRRGEGDRLVGEWSKFASQGEPEDAEIMWTFLPGGVFRINAVDRRTGEQIRGMGGQWQVEGRELILVEEFWCDKDCRSMQTVEQFRVLWVRESELVPRRVAVNGRPKRAEEDLRFRRLETSRQDPGDEG